jgi:hypothetical protein
MLARRSRLVIVRAAMDRSLVVLPFLVGACTATPAATPRVEAAPRTQPEVPSVTAEELTRADELTLGDLTLTQNGAPGLVLARNGTVTADQRVLGTLGSDGRFIDPRGRLLAELTHEGEVVTGNGDYLPVSIDDAGTIRLLKENRVIRLKPDGTLEGVNPQAPAVTVKGVTPATTRAALFLLVLSAYPVRPGS